VTSALQAFADAGLWPGLGRTRAARLAKAGITTRDEVSTQALQRIDGVGIVAAGRLMDAFHSSADVLDVVELLQPTDLDPRLAGRIVRAVGPGAATAVRSNPWRLLDADGTDPAMADGLARVLQVTGADLALRRGVAIAEWVLRRAATREGHTAMSIAELAGVVARFKVDSEVVLPAAVEHGRVMVDGPLAALERYGMAEDDVAQGIARLIATAEPWGSGAEVADHLDDTQTDAVHKALQHGVSLLTGGPGTGKSRTIEAIVAAAQARGHEVALAAPTGRAAKRLEELAEHPASTLHRLLGAQGLGADGEPGGFTRGEDWPVDADLVVVDETSMLDVELASALLEALADGTHLVLVGDPAQLPSVGPGSVLGDLLAIDALPQTELTTLYRQAEGGAIARLAAGVRAGELPAPPAPAECGYEVVVLPVQGSDAAARQVVPLVTRSIPDRLGIPAAQVQVVTPVHRGPAGTRALNAALKQALNPGKGERNGFDVGDRVVATANKIETDGGGYANGELGTVTALPEKGGVEVAFPAGPVIVKGKDLGDLVHGWCLTVHRAQGSEWPAVVVVLPPESGGLLSRPLVYTGITRAQKHLSVVTALGSALARAVAQVGVIPRTTRLTALTLASLQEI
jgi:exodeoxyribonuclease V alpha subunit